MKRNIKLLLLIVIGLLFVTGCHHTVKVRTNYSILNVYYKDCGNVAQNVSDGDIINRGATYDAKVYINLNVRIDCELDRKKDLPIIYRNLNEIYYDLYLDEELVGTIGKKLSVPFEMEWKEVPGKDDEFAVDNVLNTAINLPQNGVYKLIFYFDYTIGNKNYAETKSISFVVAD